MNEIFVASLTIYSDKVIAANGGIDIDSHWRFSIFGWPGHVCVAWNRTRTITQHHTIQTLHKHHSEQLSPICCSFYLVCSSCRTNVEYRIYMRCIHTTTWMIANRRSTIAFTVNSLYSTHTRFQHMCTSTYNFLGRSNDHILKIIRFTIVFDVLRSKMLQPHMVKAPYLLI